MARKAWISFIDLEIGETLKTLDGTTVVQLIDKWPGCEPIYNIEVDGDHVYWVGESGVLVRNDSVAFDVEACMKELTQRRAARGL